MPQQLHTRVLTIANAASLSDAVDLSGLTIVGLIMPGTWTAAPITFQASFDNATYNDAYNSEGAEYLINVLASRHVVLTSLNALFSTSRYLKLRSGTAAVPVAQGGSRSLTLLLEPS